MLCLLLKNKILTLFILFVVLTMGVFLFGKQREKLEVYAIKYGDSFYHSRNIYYEDNFNKPLPFAWMFYVIKYQNKIILIDTGFRKEEFIESFKIDYRNPLELLGQLNIKPEKVTDVILTHSHFDHIGNVDKFINAKIYIQKDELDYFKKNSKNKEIIDFLENSKNLITFDEFYRLYNFLKIEKIGGHSIGSSVVSFSHKDKNYIITGDECYLIDNCKGEPIGTYYDINKNKEFIEKLNVIDNKIILTFHEPLILETYSKINDLIVEVIPLR